MNSSYSTSTAFKLLQVLKEHSGVHPLISTAFGREFLHRSPQACEQIFGSRWVPIINNYKLESRAEFEWVQRVGSSLESHYGREWGKR